MKRKLLVVFIFLIFAIPVVFSACYACLTCNVKSTPETSGLIIEDFSGHCYSIAPIITNNTEEDLVLNKFYFQGKEFYLSFCEKNHGWNPTRNSCDLDSNISKKRQDVFIVPPGEAGVLDFAGGPAFNGHDVRQDLTGNPEADVWVLEGPSIKITGNFICKTNVFECEGKYVNTMAPPKNWLYENLLLIVLIVIFALIILGFYFYKKRRVLK